jgi:hypothetical protein
MGEKNSLKVENNMELKFETDNLKINLKISKLDEISILNIFFNISETFSWIFIFDFIS